eukprot:15472430-Alexandrium_andersonii.AAC.1
MENVGAPYQPVPSAGSATLPNSWPSTGLSGRLRSTVSEPNWSILEPLKPEMACCWTVAVEVHMKFTRWQPTIR